LCLGLVSGCSGDNRLNVKGRLLKSGAPLKLQDPDFVRVIFFPVTTNGRPPANTYLAAVDDAEGTFEAVGPDGRGVPPGKYRIAIELNRTRKDALKGAFDGDRSPFVFDIDAGTPELVIDLDKPPAK
jgi:hypothetical protein